MRFAKIAFLFLTETFIDESAICCLLACPG